MKTLTLMMAVVMMISLSSFAQLGNLKDAKNKVNSTTDKISIGKDKDKTEDKESENIGSSSEKSGSGISLPKANQEKLESGKGYFSTTFKSGDYKTEVNVGDELFVRMNLGKTMIEYAEAAGLESSFSAYGYITVYIDGVKAFTSNQISFASNISKVWTYIDIPINVNPGYGEQLAANPELLETDQDIWVLQQLFQEKSIPVMYTTAAITKMTSGSHDVKVEFGLGESSSKEPSTTICSGTVKVVVDAAGSEALSEKGPKHLRPLKEEEKGKFIFNTTSFTPGMSELNFKLQLPKQPKYYTEKWCQSSSCDYDHGTLSFYVTIDGEPFVSWESVLWNENYEVKKEFDMIILPLTDAGIEDPASPFNSSVLNKNANPITYALFDMLYGGQLKPGKHTLTFKFWSTECVPMSGANYEFTNNFYDKYPSIALGTIEINVTQEGLDKLANSSSAKKLTHGGGEWVAKDAQLKGIYAGNSEVQVLDVAVQTEWKYNKNYYGVILSRECKADVLSKGKYGYRIARGVIVVEESIGDGKYAAPTYSTLSGIPPAELNEWVFPVPAVKVK